MFLFLYTLYIVLVSKNAGRFVRRGRPLRKVEVLGVVVSTDQKERYIRFTCMHLSLLDSQISGILISKFLVGILQ